MLKNGDIPSWVDVCLSTLASLEVHALTVRANGTRLIFATNPASIVRGEYPPPPYGRKAQAGAFISCGDASKEYNAQFNPDDLHTRDATGLRHTERAGKTTGSKGEAKEEEGKEEEGHGKTRNDDGDGETKKKNKLRST